MHAYIYIYSITQMNGMGFSFGNHLELHLSKGWTVDVPLQGSNCQSHESNFGTK